MQKTNFQTATLLGDQIVQFSYTHTSFSYHVNIHNVK